MSKSTAYAVLLLLVFWTGVIGWADYVVFGTAVRQYLSGSFETTTGKIVVSEVTKLRILHSGVTLSYVYVVNGKEYRGAHFRYGDEYSSYNAEAVLRKFPNGFERMVYFNPKSPADSVLSPGIIGSDLMMILFSTPVNVLLIVMWTWMLNRLRETRRAPEAGGVRYRRQKQGLRVYLTDMRVWETGLYALGATSFAATFPVVVTLGFDPPLHPMEQTWLAVLAVAAGASVWKAVRNASGAYDLWFDEGAQTITLPLTGGRRQPVTFPRGQMAGVSMQRRVSRSASGSYYSYLPTIKRRDPQGGLRHEPLVAWGWSEEKAHSFSQWLSGQLGVEFKGIEDEQVETEARV